MARTIRRDGQGGFAVLEAGEVIAEGLSFDDAGTVARGEFLHTYTSSCCEDCSVMWGQREREDEEWVGISGDLAHVY